MSELTAVLLALPWFAFSLDPSASVPALVADAQAPLVASLAPSIVAQAAAAEADDDRRYTEEVRRRREIGQVHRALGIATWASMTATVALGLIQYYNLYGFGDGQDTNPCATGRAVFGQEQCYGIPWPHRISAITTSALYSVTFALSLVMPDPNQVSQGRGEFAERLRIHQALRWVHLVGMVAQAVLGIALTSGAFGDRANDYGTLQAVAIVHQIVGWTTWGTLTAAGALMIF